MIEKRLRIPYPVIVEGKYDRQRLLSVIDAHIITTDGFGVFKKNEKTALFRTLAQNGGVILLTDSDGAGKLIRSHLMSCLPKDKVINLYTPEIFGKEKRKAAPSAEGKLGVEGMDLDSTARAGLAAGSITMEAPETINPNLNPGTLRARMEA